MWTKKQKTTEKVTFKITDTHISCITVLFREGKYTLKNFQEHALEKGIIAKGDILRPEALLLMIKKMSLGITNKSISLLLPHDLFLCSEGVLSKHDMEKPLRTRVKDYFKKNTKKESWHKTHVCEFSNYVVKDRQAILFRCLPKDIYKNYIHIYEKAGLVVSSINSTALAFDHVLPKNRSTFVYVDHNHTRVIDLKDGLYISSKSFEFSYDQLVQDIVKNINIEKAEAKKILSRYGLLRSHKDQRVYKRLMRSASPILDFLRKRKVKESSQIKIVFGDVPLLGFVDLVQKNVSGDISELDILDHEGYVFDQILDIHKKDSYRYQSHIAESLRNFS